MYTLLNLVASTYIFMYMYVLATGFSKADKESCGRRPRLYKWYILSLDLFTNATFCLYYW